MIEFFQDLWLFLKERKKWFLLPMIVLLLLIGALLVFVEGSAIGSFVYTLSDCRHMSVDSSNRDRDLLGISTGFLILFVIFQVKWLLYLALGVGLAGVFLPASSQLDSQRLECPYSSHCWLNSRIILSVLFFCDPASYFSPVSAWKKRSHVSERQAA